MRKLAPAQLTQERFGAGNRGGARPRSGRLSHGVPYLPRTDLPKVQVGREPRGTLEAGNIARRGVASQTVFQEPLKAGFAPASPGSQGAGPPVGGPHSRAEP